MIIFKNCFFVAFQDVKWKIFFYDEIIYYFCLNVKAKNDS